MSPQRTEPVQTAFAERIRLVFDSARIGTWEWDPEADHVVWSENFERLHGFEPGAFGSSLAAYANRIHPDDRARIAEALRACAAGGEDYHVEYRLIDPGGEVHHVEANGSLTRDPERGPRLIGVCRDVTAKVRLLEAEREARREAQNSELHYRALAAMIPQQVWTATPEGALDFVNQRTVEYFGRPFDEVIGAGWQDVVHPEDLPAVIERWTHSLRTGEGYEVEFRLRQHDGAYRWHLGRAVPVRENGGTIVRWLGTNTDVHDRKREHALTLAQVEVASLLVNARSLDEVGPQLLEAVCRNLAWTCAQLWTVDREANVLRRSAGWSSPALAPEAFEALATFDTMPFGSGLPGRIWRSKEPAWITELHADTNFPRLELVERIGLRSGFGFPLIVAGEVTAVLELFSREPQALEQPTVAMTSTFGTQIGQFIQRISAEKELSDTLHRLRHLQTITDAALSHLSLDELLDDLLVRICEAVVCDVAVVLLLDRDRDELYPVATYGSGVHLPEGIRLKVGESLAGRAAATRKTIVARDITSLDYIRPEIREMGILSAMAVPLLQEQRLLGILIVGAKADTSFRQDEVAFVELVGDRVANALANSALYEQAQQSNRMKDRFLSMASHELKTPMTGILGWTALLKDETDPKMRAEAIDHIEQSARIQARLIEDFLDSARIREGKLVLRTEPMDLSAVLAEAARVVEPAAERRGVALDVAIPDRPVPIEGDAGRLEQVAWNLLSNAIKFTEPGKHVRARIETDDMHASILVEDEGVGIAPDFLTRLFRPFEQEEHGVRGGGLGLGLHIVSSIVELHGGTVEARSAGPGQGASFIVRLPLREPRISAD